eukprot:jgi/Chrzof1/7891/Cz02g40060.t1
MLRFSGTSVPPDYEHRFQHALWAFRHNRVYCAQSHTLVHLSPLPAGGIGAADVDVVSAIPTNLEDLRALPFLGPLMDDAIAQGIAKGLWCGSMALCSSMVWFLQLTYILSVT